MIRKYAGSGLMVGLALLTGCGPALYMQSPISLSPPPRAEPLRAPGDAAPAQAEGVARPAAAWPAASAPGPVASAPGPVQTDSAPGMPEAYGLRVSARQPGEAAQACSVLPRGEAGKAPAPFPLQTAELTLAPAPPVPPAPSRAAPEVVLEGVGAEKGQGVTQASWVAPAAGGDAREAPQVIPPESHTPPSAPARPVDPGYGHAPDYSWLAGELEYLRSKNVWRLRYAPADQEDRYGGTVLLVGDGLPPDCKSGQVVRVEGQLVNPDADEARPPYWVKSFRVLKPPLPTEE